MVVISQLALQSLVRSNPTQHLPNSNPNASKYPQKTITDFNYESSYLLSLTCNMDVRVILADQLADLPTVEASSAKNGNFRFLLLKLI